MNKVVVNYINGKLTVQEKSMLNYILAGLQGNMSIELILK